jgi:endonuclease G
MKTIWFLLFATVLNLGWSQTTSSLAALITYGGLPKIQDTSNLKILANTAFINGYSEKMKAPLWTVYRLGNMKGAYSDTSGKWERTDNFRTDPRTKSKINQEAYKGTGYDRGHMAPNNSILVQYGQMAQLETFFMSNICPQSPVLNQGIWKHLEQFENELLAQDDEKNKQVTDLFVICGPIYSAKPDTTKTGIPIPTSYYRILVYAKGYGAVPKAVAFIFPQDVPGGKGNKQFLDFVTTVDEIEKLTGIDFFTDLSAQKQKNLESVMRNFKLEEIVK